MEVCWPWAVIVKDTCSTFLLRFWAIWGDLSWWFGISRNTQLYFNFNHNHGHVEVAVIKFLEKTSELPGFQPTKPGGHQETPSANRCFFVLKCHSSVLVSQHHNACSNAMDNGALNPQQKCEARNETATGGWKLAIFPGRPLYKNLFEFKQSKGYFKDMIIWYHLIQFGHLLGQSQDHQNVFCFWNYILAISPEGPIADAHCWMKAGIFPKERASQGLSTACWAMS